MKTQKAIALVLAAVAGLVFAGNAHAATILGTGTGNLAHGKTIGGRTFTDLTDPENDANSTSFYLNGHVTASFNVGNVPPPITTPSQNAHNLFENNVGAKLCCNGPTQNVTFQFSDNNAFPIDAYTLASSNDSPGRDPIDWTLSGSNDGTNFTPFHTVVGTTNTPSGNRNSNVNTIWSSRNQVMLFDSSDFTNTTAYEYIRFEVTRTDHNPEFALGEIELFADGFSGGPNVAPLLRPGRIISGLASGTQEVGGMLDLTDPESDGVPNDYAPPNLGGFDAEFTSTDEPGFGGGQFSFNVFDDNTGSKWCCNDPGSSGHQLDAELVAGPHVLEAFTLTSSNDSPNRDPVIFEILGSNDGVDFDVIFAFDGLNNSYLPLWPSRGQTRLFQDGVDGVQFLSTEAYSIFRYNVIDTLGGHALAEIEYFGSAASAIPEPITILALGMGITSLGGYIRKRRRA